MFYVTKHAANGRSYTYPASYVIVGFLLKAGAVLCVPMLLAGISIHQTIKQNLLLIALAAPGILILGVKLARLGVFKSVARMWRERAKQATSAENVVNFRKPNNRGR